MVNTSKSSTPSLTLCHHTIGAPLVPTNDFTETDLCGICIESLNKPGPDGLHEIFTLSCNHSFHLMCIGGWVEVAFRSGTRLSCPICRSNVLPEDLGQINQAALQAVLTYSAIPPTVLPASAPLSTPAQSPTTGVRVFRPRAFLYIFASQLGYGRQNVNNLMFMIGHRHRPTAYDPYPYSKWGVPGGLEDITDGSTLVNAVREFLEETKEGRDTEMTVDQAIRLMNDLGTLQSMTASSSATSYYLLEVPSVESFERLFGFKHYLTSRQKAVQQLSNETAGWIWLTTETIDRGYITRFDQTGMLVGPEFVQLPRTRAFRHTLRVRDYSLGGYSMAKLMLNI